MIQDSFLFLANPQSQTYFAIPAPLNTVTGPFVASDNNIWTSPTQTGCSSSPTGHSGSSTWTNSTCTPSQRNPQTSSPNASRLQAPHPSPLFLITIFKTKKNNPIRSKHPKKAPEHRSLFRGHILRCCCSLPTFPFSRLSRSC